MLDYLFKIIQLDHLREWIEDKRFAKRAGLRSTARRVLQVFDKHDIPVTRIPQIFPQFNLQFSDFDSLDSVVDILNADFLDALCQHFFISRKWLDTGIEPIQELYENGYDFDALYNLIQQYDIQNEALFAYFIAENRTKLEPVEAYSTNEHVLVMLEHTVIVDENFEYNRYLPIYHGYWHYYKTRMMLKSLSLLLFQSNIPQRGYFIKRLTEDEIPQQFAINFLKQKSMGIWHPDDYIFCNGKSLAGKDLRDAKEMHDYLKARNYFDKIKALRRSEFLDH